MADDYIPGDHWVIDDRTGFKVRSSSTRREWTGAIVDRSQFEPRHPQDFVRAKPERAIVRNPRPRPVDVFAGPLDTTLAAAALAGAVDLVVTSSARMQAGDYLNILLDDGGVFRVLLTVVVDSTHITIGTALPGSASAGNMVFDNSAMAPAVLP